MSELNKIELELTNEYRNTFKEELVNVKSCYPDKNWNVWTWSYRLLNDFKKFKNLNYLQIFFGYLLLKLNISIFDKNSSHFDFTRKIYLYQILLIKDNSKKLIIPECGPCGFELLIAQISGFKNIHTYDISPDFTKICQRSHNSPSITFETTDSKELPSSLLDQSDTLFIVPDWNHIKEQDLQKPNIIIYSKSDNFKFHLKQIQLKTLIKLKQNLK